MKKVDEEMRAGPSARPASAPPFSLPDIDLLADLARREPGVYGARLTGGGFGGSVVLLTRAGEARAVALRVVAEYRRRTGREGRLIVPEASAGRTSEVP